ncbi:hypothetical protein B0T19DRAFT_212644 [Cercophora scortea]|uniref:DUF7704 domain-containing protein n=1 Tax=Cercophora scortea TaxID=314031 RepID=A0AAE0IES0_9PEZI|nr:hypothetical protein B0T19DRAFT_212644 [Cercophora scortea]
MSPTAAISATASVPSIYRFVLTTLEPLFALSGALMTLGRPDSYAATMTRGAVPYTADTQFLYTQLGGAWLHFAFNAAVVMRLFDDLRLWRWLCAGMLLSDVAYWHSAAQAVGGWAAWAVLADWTSNDWVVFATNLLTISVRILILLGVGVKSGGSGDGIGLVGKAKK